MTSPAIGNADLADESSGRVFKPRGRWAAILNLLLPGLGYLYAGHPYAAAAALSLIYLWIVAVLLLSFVVPSAPFRVVLLLTAIALPYIVLPLHAARAARQNSPMQRRVYQRWYVLLGVWVVSAGIVQGQVVEWVKAHVAEAFRIPGGSMEPTLLSGDVLFVSHGRTGDVTRGDVLVYSVPDNADRYIHRLVALPGDTITMRAFRLVVNGRAAEYSDGRNDDAASDSTTDLSFEWQRDRLLSGMDAALYHPTYGTWGPLVLQDDEYFVLGDEVANSFDSRFRGPLSIEAFVGRPEWVYFSRDPRSGDVRWSRIGKAVR